MSVRSDRPQGFWARVMDHDVTYSFTRSPLAMLAALITTLAILAAMFAPVIAPFDPFDPSQISLWDGKKPPAWEDGGDPLYLLGTDNQGRDMLSTILYGGRISILVGFAAVAFGMVMGVGLGVLAGYIGGWLDAVIMRAADVQLTIPGILVAILINGILRSVLPVELRDELAIYVVILAIGLSDWPQFARVARGATLVEAKKEYVQAARVIGLRPGLIMIRHIVPNVLRPVLVLATIGLALAIIAEATLSFLGAGIPPPTPAWGVLISEGREYISTAWWQTAFPGVGIFLVVMSLNFLGDWARDRFDPRLRQLIE